MHIVVRQARESDVSAIRHLEKQLINFERPYDSDIREGEDISYYNLEKLLASDNIYLVVAEVDEQIVGCAFGEVIKSLDWAKSNFIGHIRMVYIEEVYRKHGVGKAIFVELKEWFREKKIENVFIEFYQKNINAFEAYKKLGFSSYTMVMKMNKE